MLYPVKRLACFGLLSLATTILYANNFPRGCEVSGFGYRNNYLVLNPEGEQTFFLIQNRLDKAIKLQRHETRDVFMSPKMEASFAPKNWAAFASDENNVNFQCLIQDNDNTTILNCSDVLDVCQYPRARFALSNMGTYWVSSNKPQNLVIKEAVAKGIYLKW